MPYLDDREQSGHPRSRASKRLPAANVDSRLDQANRNEPALTASAIQERRDACLELVDKHRSLGSITLGFGVLRGG